MSLTLSDAITQVRGVLNEATASFWTDAEITYWIQEGCRDFSSKTLMVEAEDDITLVAGQLSYDSTDEPFIATVIEPYAAIYYTNAGDYKGILKTHPRKLGNLHKFTAGTPLFYTLHNRKIYVWPLTTATEVAAGAKINLLYSKVTDDVTEITDEYQHIPIIYAMARAKMKDQKFAEASALMSQYVMVVNFERADKHGREEDTFDMFKTKPGGGEAGAR